MSNPKKLSSAQARTLRLIRDGKTMRLHATTLESLAQRGLISYRLIVGIPTDARLTTVGHEAVKAL